MRTHNITTPTDYLRVVEATLLASPVVHSYEIIRSWANTDDGYIRVRCRLVNGDFLELAEYFVVSGSHVETVDYRHQWMDATQSVLRRRWDNTPHHPELPEFPYHVHVGPLNHVRPDKPRSILDILALLESQL